MFCPQCGRSLNGESTCSFCAGGTGPSAQGAPSNYNASPYAYSSYSSGGGYAAGSDDSIPTFTGAFHRFWTRYASGRASRTEFWFSAAWIFLIFMLFFVLLAVVAALFGTETPEGGVDMGPMGLVVLFPFVLYSLGVSVKMVFLNIRRLHDVGLSGWLCLIGFIPTLGFFWVLVIALIPSQHGKNRYGRQPRY